MAANSFSQTAKDSNMNHFLITDDSRFPLYIFDLDGTLALIDHRRHMVESPWFEAEPGHKLANGQRFKIEGGVTFVRDSSFKPDWNAFYQACDKDQPNWPIIGTMLHLYTIGCDIRIWSGREDSVKQKTLMWLHMFTKIPLIKLDQMLQMRETGDYTEDHQLKRKWLNTLKPQARKRLCAVFDDRDKAVKMWRGEGVTCCQVAPGDF